jgi:Domain of unknown function (DUF4412)
MLSRTNFIYTFLFSLVIFCVSSSSQTDFEGKIVMKITGNETSNIVYYVQGENTRMEVESHGKKVAILHNKKDSNSEMLMDEQKMYMEFPRVDMSKTDIKESDVADKIKKTGEYKTINGYKCEKWTFTDDNGQTGEAWMTDQLGGFFMLQNPMMKNQQDDWKQKLIGNYFPMLVTVNNDSGEKEFTMEVVSVDKMSLNKDLFEIPSGYQKFSMPNMPGMNNH